MTTSVSNAGAWLNGRTTLRPSGPNLVKNPQPLKKSPHWLYLELAGVASRVAAAFLLFFALPVIALLVVLVRMSSPGPGIYRQARMGRGGKIFTAFKIRTMRNDAEKGTGPVWSTPNDPRVTPLGAILRKTHLDELPQLFNVLAGDMALVGPRPERPEIVEKLATQVEGYLDRLAMLPGVTGLAQITLPPDVDIDGVRRKLAVDLHYIQHASLLMDLVICFKTSLKMIGLFEVKMDAPLPDFISEEEQRRLGIIDTQSRADFSAPVSPHRLVAAPVGDVAASNGRPHHAAGHELQAAAPTMPR